MTQERPAPARPWFDVIMRELAQRGWTKVELSERSGVARTTIDNWATNPRKPSARAVNDVADALGIRRERAHVLAGILPLRERPDFQGAVEEFLASRDSASEQREGTGSSEPGKHAG